MPIDLKIEAPTRKLLGHAIRGELDGVYKVIGDIGPDGYQAVGPLLIMASGYIAVATARRWPNTADIKALARHAATAPGAQVTEDEIREYLTRVVIGDEFTMDVFEGNEQAPLIPLFATAALLLAFHGLYEDQWAYLDAIWNSLDAAEAVEAPVAPAVMYLFVKSNRKQATTDGQR